MLSVFQSESEQDEEGTGSMGSAAVAVSLVFVSPLLLVFRVRGEGFEHLGLRLVQFIPQMTVSIRNTHPLLLGCRYYHFPFSC